MAGHRPTVEALIAGGAAPDDRHNDHRSTLLHWAQWSSREGYQLGADYVGVIETLIAARAALPDHREGSPEVRELLRRHGVSD